MQPLNSSFGSCGMNSAAVRGVSSSRCLRARHACFVAWAFVRSSPPIASANACCRQIVVMTRLDRNLACGRARKYPAERKLQGADRFLTTFLLEHIMNMLIRASPRRSFERPRRSAKRRRRRGENVAPAEASQVERREAPHPYVTGVRAPSQGARRTLARFARGASQRTPAPPGAPFPLRAREKEKGERATPGARKSKVPGRRSVV